MAANNNKTVGISILAIFLVVAAVAAVIVNKNDDATSATDGSGSGSGSDNNISSSKKAVESLCKNTRYSETCNAKLAGATNSTDTKELVEAAFNVAIKEIGDAMGKSKLLQDASKDPRTSRAFKACQVLLEDSKGDIKRAVDRVADYASALTDTELFMNDLKIFLSGALTLEQTCLDGFAGTKGDTGEKMKKLLVTAQQLTGNTLEMVDQVHEILSSLNITGLGLKRRLMADDELPSWATTAQRRLLLQDKAAHVAADVVVAKDGSGKYKTINEALKDIPPHSEKPFVIHIKAGVYAEYVNITEAMTNVVFIGDGPTKTKITGDRSFVAGYSPSESGTVIIYGNGFMAKNIGIENTAGPNSHQAVALRVQADKAIFFHCHFNGYQNTLFAHVHRQFYRDCTITGTIDIIFGNAASVFQSCNFMIRKPLINDDGMAQTCTVTAHGRMQPDEPTGIVIMNSNITASPEYLSSTDPITSFLGRPWQQYSRVVVMNTKINAPIDPEGWTPFQGTWGLDDCYFAEFNNTGKGADVSKRAKWPGIKASITKQEAEGFAPKKFILGDNWIPATGVPYDAGFV